MKKYGKGLLAAMLALVLAVGSLLPVYGEETDPLTLESKSAVLMDAATGTVLYEKNSHEAMLPASVTKIMTMLLIYEAEEAGRFNKSVMVYCNAETSPLRLTIKGESR